MLCKIWFSDLNMSQIWISSLYCLPPPDSVSDKWGWDGESYSFAALFLFVCLFHSKISIPDLTVNPVPFFIFTLLAAIVPLTQLGSKRQRKKEGIRAMARSLRIKINPVLLSQPSLRTCCLSSARAFTWDHVRVGGGEMWKGDEDDHTQITWLIWWGKMETGP